VLTASFERKTHRQPAALRTGKYTLVLLSAIFIGCAPAPSKCSAERARHEPQNQQAKSSAAVNPEEHIDVTRSDSQLILIQSHAPIPVLSVHRTEQDGAEFTMRPGIMQISFCKQNIVHVLYSPADKMSSENGPAVLDEWNKCKETFELAQTATTISLATGSLSVRVERATGSITFLTPSGEVILAEPPNGGKAMQRATVNGEDTYHLEQQFVSPHDEALYGMGEKQDGMWNWRGIPVELINDNTVGGIPVMVSSRGYGVLWNNESQTQFNPMNADEEVLLKPSTRTGTYRAPETGEYVFFADGGDGAGDIGIAVEGHTTHNIKNMWVPYTSVTKERLIGGRTYSVQLLGGGKSARLYCRPLESATVFRSETGNNINYYFIYGPGLDKVVAGYRLLTGSAPLFPKWAFGFWQSREHYSSQEQLLQAAGDFRARHIPVDLMVQDWQYWPKGDWGAYQFSTRRYPNPEDMVKKLHEMHMHFMISVWPDPKGPVRDALASHHGLIGDTGYVNEFYSEARKIRWDYLKKNMFDIGADAWWQDGEDAYGQVRNQKVYIGQEGYVSGNRYTNAYPQFANQCIYEAQRSNDSEKRVVQLGKSCTLGMQRYAAATWSGDVHGNWQTLGWQVPAGLNVSIAGIPYWTTDTGGFFRPKDEYSSPGYNNLLVRWFEFSTFCPILRVHGFRTATEMWKWPLAYKYLLKYDQFRYRMLPYLYSEGWRVSDIGYTLMRPLVMDFQKDRDVYNVDSQYMFGSAFMVAPVTQPLDQRSVYLPRGTKWTNFWTGESLDGGRRFMVKAPLDEIPLFIHSGTILPLGPVMQYASQRPEDPIELRIYAGENGTFTLYEDQNDGYGYEKGLCATIQFEWNDRAKTLTVEDRQGDFPGMIRARKFLVVLVRPHYGVGLDQTSRPDRVISYTGSKVTVQVEAR
jgi:alpha-D-xyloside xylohydrolase